jgi:anti-sigma B factor antagonist
VSDRTAPGGDSGVASAGKCRIEDDSTQKTSAILSAYGELDLHVTPELQDRIDAAIDDGAKLVVLDLSAVTFIDSMALGVLLGAVNQLRARGGNLRLVVPSRELRRIFEISLLDRVFTLDATRDEACAQPLQYR